MLSKPCSKKGVKGPKDGDKAMSMRLHWKTWQLEKTFLSRNWWCVKINYWRVCIWGRSLLKRSWDSDTATSRKVHYSFLIDSNSNLLYDTIHCSLGMNLQLISVSSWNLIATELEFHRNARIFCSQIYQQEWHLMSATLSDISELASWTH